MRTFWLWFCGVGLAWDLAWLGFDIENASLVPAIFRAVGALVLIALIFYWVDQD